MQSASATKNTSALRGWNQEDMMNANNDVEFNGYYIIETSKKHGIVPTSMHY